MIALSPLANNKIRLIVTGKCNLDCFYCHNEGQAKEETFIRLADVKTLATALESASVRAAELTISGGEPLLHPDLLSLVAVARTFSDEVTMVSNGVLATPELLVDLARSGLRKLRVGVDSLDMHKPRPSPGRLSSPFSLNDVVTAGKEAGLEVDLNVVVTKFNRKEIGRLAWYAVTNRLSIKFFEHVEVNTYGTADQTGAMIPRPHVDLSDVLAEIEQALGVAVAFGATEDFGESNLAFLVDGVELRYCRYLCPYELCWLTGTRIDAEGFIYNCMVNRGLDRLRSWGGAEVLDTLRRASARPCRARFRGLA